MSKSSKIILMLLLVTLMNVNQSKAQGFDFLWGGVANLTGQGLIDKLKDAAIAIIDKAENSANSVARNVSAELNKNADNLKAILGDNVAKPLTELRRSFETQIEKSLVALNQVQAFLNSYRVCFKNDVQQLLNGLDATLTYNISNAIPWAKDRPLILNIKRTGTESFLGMRVSNEPQLLEISGTNFLQNSRCNSELSLEDVNTGDKIQAKIVSINPRTVTIGIPPINKAGVYKIRLGFRERNLFGCKSPKSVEATFVVLPEAKFDFAYTIVPSCVTKQTISFAAGELHGTNDECNGWKTFSQNFVMPTEWKYTGYNWNVTSNNGCEGGATYSGGNMVSVSYRCPEKGGIFCTGARKWIHGTMTIFGEKEVAQPGASIQGKFPNSLKFGQSVSINPISASDCASNGTWTVGVSVVFPDGTKYDIPSTTGDRPLSSSLPNGVAFYWNPATLSLTVNAPPANCGEY